MQDTKIEISPAELRGMTDTSFFDLKTSVMQKVSGLLGELQFSREQQRSRFENRLPEGVFSQTGKISRGENYRGYPYLVLDYPRLFEKQNTFAYRSMFWWGNYFSYTLHIGGKYYEACKNNFITNFELLKIPGVYVCVNDHPWEYHFETSNYVPAQSIGAGLLAEKKFTEQPFIKLSFRSELSTWQHVKTDGMHAFELFLKVLF